MSWWIFGLVRLVLVKAFVSWFFFCSKDTGQSHSITFTRKIVYVKVTIFICMFVGWLAGWPFVIRPPAFLINTSQTEENPKWHYTVKIRSRMKFKDITNESTWYYWVVTLHLSILFYLLYGIVIFQHSLTHIHTNTKMAGSFP